MIEISFYNAPTLEQAIANLNTQYYRQGIANQLENGLQFHANYIHFSQHGYYTREIKVVEHFPPPSQYEWA